jgi:hypothetical protein
VLGKYIISDQPMTEEQCARERATVIDAEPAFGDGREENHLAAVWRTRARPGAEAYGGVGAVERNVCCICNKQS